MVFGSVIGGEEEPEEQGGKKTSRSSRSKRKRIITIEAKFVTTEKSRDIEHFWISTGARSRLIDFVHEDKVSSFVIVLE